MTIFSQRLMNQLVNLILNEGIHMSYMFEIPSNIKIVIPTNTTIKLANDLILDHQCILMQ